MRRFTVVLEWDPRVNSYAVLVPSLPDCTSQGRTIDEAVVNAKEAIGLHVEGLSEAGLPIPEEPKTPVFVVISVAA